MSLDRHTAEDAVAKASRVQPNLHSNDEGRGLSSKYYAAMLLCKARIRFFFWEMDLCYRLDPPDRRSWMCFGPPRRHRRLA